MRIGVLSDTHDRLVAAGQALQFFHEQNVALAIHCGDWKTVSSAVDFARRAKSLALPVTGVLGNNDIEVEDFLDAAASAGASFNLYTGAHELQAGDKSLAVYHGHHKPTLTSLKNGPHSILLLGHTHKPDITRLDDKLLVNPGSTAFAIPRSKVWNPSVAIVDTEAMSAELHFLAAL